MKEKRFFKHGLVVVSIAVALLLCSVAASLAAGPIRVVVLPFYSEEGVDVKQGGSATNHYRRMMRFVNNQLVRNDFEVINPFAADAAERELDRIQQIAREDSVRAVLDVTKKYGVDAAYVVWLKVKINKTEDGYCKASARADGEGYDSAGRDLGAGMSKTFNITRRDCDDAIAEVEKEVGDLVGRKLTAGSGPVTGNNVVVPATEQAAAAVVPAAAAGSATGGVLADSINKYQDLVTVRLDQATDYAVAEVFGKVVNTVRGVVDAKMFSQRIVADTPQASFVTWRLTLDGNETEPFRLQANIMKMIGDISGSGGTIVINGVPYDYTPSEIDMLKGVRPGDATTREIQFVVDRELVRDKEMAGQDTGAQAGKTKGFD